MHDCSPFPIAGAAAVPTSPLLLPATTCRRELAAAFAVCRLCHGPARAGCILCWSCRQVGLGFGGVEVAPPVVPMCVVPPSSGAHQALVAYKASASGVVRRMAKDSLVAFASRWLSAHLSCAGGTRGDREDGLVLVPVPSTTGGRSSWKGRHPVGELFEAALCSSGAPGAVVVEALVPGPLPPRRLCPSELGFTASSKVSGRCCVVVDDLFVSGARARSAARALEQAGASVAAIVTLGRYARPDHNLATAAYWAAFGSVPARAEAPCPSCPPAPCPKRARQVRARARLVATARVARFYDGEAA